MGATVAAKDALAEDVVASRLASVSPRSSTAANLADAMCRRMYPLGPQLAPPRETELLRLVAESPRSLRESTASTHISKINEKFGAANSTQTIMWRSGELQPGANQV